MALLLQPLHGRVEPPAARSDRPGRQDPNQREKTIGELIKRLTGLILCLLAVSGWAAVASAQSITAIRVNRNQAVTQLWIDSDAPLKYQVELSDPQTVVVHLAGVQRASQPPRVDPNDPTVQSVQVRPEPGGLVLVVRTKSPGVTVLPFYEAATRRLTLEMGGAPSLQVQVKPPPPAPPAGPAKPATTGQKPAAPTAPQPTVRPAPAATAKPPPQVKAVRLGTHGEYTRLVLDGTGRLQARFTWSGDQAAIRLARAVLSPRATLAPPDQRVTAIKAVRQRPLVLGLTLARPVIWHRLFSLDSGRKVVVDVMLSSRPAAKLATESKPKAPPSQPTVAAPAVQPAISAKTKADPSRKPRVAALPSPAPPTTLVRIIPPDRPVSPVKPTAAIPRPPAAKPTAPPTTADRVTPSLASPARPQPGRPYLARGIIPPVPPPEPRARVGSRPAPRVRGTIPPLDHSPPPTDQVVRRVVRAQQRGRTMVRGMMPPPEEHRPPQAGRLGPSARRARAAAALFERAKKYLEARNYRMALKAFETFIQRYPGHKLAAEAHFRMADAFYYLHQRDMLQHFDQVMKYYQRAINLFPDSNQVPWALLMMGKASMLNEEPFRALGYFKLVAEDYPKSEYLPLALNNIARAYLRQGKPLLALREFRRVIRKFPNSRFRNDAEWGIVQALFALARYQRAAGVLKEMLVRQPELYLQDPEILYYIGEAAFQQHHYAEARRYYLWALNLRPDLPDADIILTRVGDTFQFDQNPRAAREIYRQVMESFPGSDGALVAQIRLAEQTTTVAGKHPWSAFKVRPTKKALHAYLDILDNYPDRPVAQLAAVKLGVYYYKTADFEKSLAVLTKLLREHPATPYANQVRYTLELATLGLLHHLKESGRPLALMNAFLRYRRLITRPNSNEVLKLLAWAYEHAGLATRASKLYEVLVSRDLGDPSLNLALARNLMVLHDYQGVIKALTGPTADKLKGRQRDLAASLMGRSLAHIGKYAEAVKILAALAKKGVAQADDYHALGTSYSRLGKVEPALAALNKAEELLAKHQGSKLSRYLVAMEYGATARSAGRFQAAADAFRRAEGLAVGDQDKATALYELAQCLRGLKKHQEVFEAFKKLKEMNVSPWSQMAERHLTDMNLATQLVAVGE